jgi:hypothetical protein
MDYSWYITPEEYEKAEANGISRSALNSRVRRLGWPKTKAINTPLRIKYPPEIIELVKKNHISYRTFQSRIHALGWDVIKAATTPLQLVSKPRTNVFMPYKYKKYLKTMRENGICIGTFQSRIYILKWSPEKAATVPPRRRKVEA